MFLKPHHTKKYHQQLFALAIPMILSNITVPLLGLVDTAVIGHLPHAYYIGGSTVGATIITFITWLCGFLRQSSTGLAAQAYGQKSAHENLLVLLRGFFVALVLATVVIIFQQYYLDLALHFAGGSVEVQQYARQYSEIRIYALPASLANLVLFGWLLGNQQAKAVMWALIIMNVVNLVLDLLLVLHFNMAIAGVAYASLVAEYSGLLVGLGVVFIGQSSWRAQLFLQLKQWQEIITTHVMKRFFKLNRDILLRTLCLQLCFIFITFQGARLGDEVLAANAILMNFLLLISFGLDGIANAAEAMVGEAKGAKNKKQQHDVVRVSLYWTGIFAIFYCLLFIIFGQQFIHLITSIESVQQLAQAYLFWLCLMPILACWCYLYDGIYIGLMKTKVMRNSMMVSTFLGFFPLWFVLQSYGNHALWAAFSVFMVLRGITLAWYYHRKLA